MNDEVNKPDKEDDAGKTVDEIVESQEGINKNNELKAETDESKQEDDKKVDVSDTGGEDVEEVIEMVEIPKSRLEELETVEARVLEEIKMERADSINLRKRLEKQRDDFIAIASSRVLSKLLSVKDDLNRIVDNGREEIPETHFQGIELLKQRVDGIFDAEGVSLIKVEPGVTKYDPIRHEAITSIPNDDIPPNTIIEIVNEGFMKGERVLRAAKVIISKSSIDQNKKEEEEVEFSEF